MWVQDLQLELKTDMELVNLLNIAEQLGYLLTGKIQQLHLSLVTLREWGERGRPLEFAQFTQKRRWEKSTSMTTTRLLI